MQAYATDQVSGNVKKGNCFASPQKDNKSFFSFSNHHSSETKFIQPKLTINNPNDEYEREADDVADKVMRMEDQYIQPKLIPISSIQRKCDQCEEEEKRMQRKEMNSQEPNAGSSLENYVENLSSSGQPLSDEVRNFYEPRFGIDFSNVKVHTDMEAAKSAQSINALAYTSGNNIVFNNGQYAPGTDNGKKLLAHELTHVVQQNGNAYAKRIQRMTPCPRHLKSGDPTPSGWKDYYGNSCVFHCCYRGILEDKVPSQSDPQNECFYDETGRIVDSKHKYAGCGGTPNYYDASSDWLGHTFSDPGGIWHAGWDAFWESQTHSEDKRKENEAECLRGCEDVNIFLRGFCINGCLGLPPM